MMSDQWENAGEVAERILQTHRKSFDLKKLMTELILGYADKRVKDAVEYAITVTKNETWEEAIKAIPTSWLDPMVGEFDCRDIERFCESLRTRLRKLKEAPHA